MTHELAGDVVYELVSSYQPQYAWGATGANVAPMAMAPMPSGH